MTRNDLLTLFSAIRDKMAANCDYLVELDARNGDGDLGLSMRDCWAAVTRCAEQSDTEDLGMLLFACAKQANAAAPSTLGTITAFWLMGTAKALRGKTEVTLAEFAAALAAGLETICAKAGSAVGDKTILDAISPAVDALAAHAEDGAAAAAAAAYAAAKAGMEHTKELLPKHGRAAYYSEKGLGLVDGGAVAGMLLFEAASECCR